MIITCFKAKDCGFLAALREPMVAAVGEVPEVGRLNNSERGFGEL
jgi:hypothetical protein